LLFDYQEIIFVCQCPTSRFPRLKMASWGSGYVGAAGTEVQGKQTKDQKSMQRTGLKFPGTHSVDETNDRVFIPGDFSFFLQ
jgi:hypothetical protein